LLDDRDPHVTTACLEALLSWGTADSVPAVIAMLRSDRVFPVRTAAIDFLRRFPGDETTAVLTEQLSTSSAASAAEVLRALGPAAERQLAAGLTTDDRRAREQIVALLRTVAQSKTLDGDTVTALIQTVAAADSMMSLDDAIAALATIKEPRVATTIAAGIPHLRYRAQAVGASHTWPMVIPSRGGAPARSSVGSARGRASHPSRRRRGISSAVRRRGKRPKPSSSVSARRQEKTAEWPATTDSRWPFTSTARRPTSRNV